MLGFVALSDSALSDIEVAEQVIQVTQAVTGVAASVTVGTVSVNNDRTITLGSVAAISSIGSVSVIHDAAINLPAVTATASLGTASAAQDSSIPQTGVSATSAVGSLDVLLSANVDLSSVTANGEPRSEVNYTVTVADNNGNKYYIDGVSNPTLNFKRGTTYIFDLSDSSNTGHPFAFKDGQGNSYTTGVTTSGTAGQAGATVTIVVASNAPSTLRYYCTVHGEGMGNTISVSDAVSITVNADANITLAAATSTGSAGTLDVNLTANPVLPSDTVTVTAGSLDVHLDAAVELTGVTTSVTFGTAADAFDADANTALASVIATGSVSDIAEIHLTAAPILPEATATLTAASLEFDADANTNLASVSASTSLDEVEAKGAADVEIGGVDASTDTTAPTVTLSAAPEISGVSSTVAFGTAADAFDADANITVSAVVATVVANAFANVKAEAEIELGSGTAASSTSGVTVSVSVVRELTTLVADIVVDTVTANGVQFVYDPNDYDRSRVIYLNAQDRNNVVTINPELQTVYTTNVRSFNTVIIEPENRTIVVDKIPVNSTTVYIAA